MNAGEASRLVEQALARHKAGRVPEAEAILERVLAERPHHNAALHHLGLIAESRRDRRRALELLSRAAASDSHHRRPFPQAV